MTEKSKRILEKPVWNVNYTKIRLCIYLRIHCNALSEIKIKTTSKSPQLN